jgi:mannose-6-phosphate isomerase class I
MNKIYLVVPKLIEQPTWGGRYILESKDWTAKTLFKNLKIGQAYELFSGIKLRGDINSSQDASFSGELGYAMQPDKIFYGGDKSKLIPITKLIEQNPLLFLGKTVLAKHGPQIKILIKFTQARGNSFQLHVQEKDASSKWHFKAESWYYFEPGLLTLGVKPNIDWKAYKNCCLKINKEMQQLSKMVISGKISLNTAKLQAKALVKKYNPWQYVNLVKVSKGDLVDLSKAGLHHSWEEDDKYPLGNVLYEMCLDVMDPISTIRCFDDGKIQKDGRIRNLHIEDYFKYIDRSKEENNPTKHLLKPASLINNSNLKVDSLLKTKYYCLEKIVVKKSYSGEFTKLKDSFHHLFIKEGGVEIVSPANSVFLGKGHSCFIPCSLGNYEIRPVERKETTLLKTFVS